MKRRLFDRSLDSGWVADSWCGAIALLILTAPITNVHAQVIPPDPLQTEITPQDSALIEQLVQIAQKNAASVKEAKAALGLSAFEDTLTLELSPSYSSGSFLEDREQFSGTERNMAVEATISPLKIISAIEKLPSLRSKLREAKQQKRVEVVKYYTAYLQAAQTKRIAAHQMQALTTHHRAASRSGQSSTLVKSLSNPEYVTAAKEMLSANVQEKVALEELAACMGLSEQETLAVMGAENWK